MENFVYMEVDCQTKLQRKILKSFTIFEAIYKIRGWIFYIYSGKFYIERRFLYSEERKFNSLLCY